MRRHRPQDEAVAAQAHRGVRGGEAEHGGRAGVAAACARRRCGPWRGGRGTSSSRSRTAPGERRRIDHDLRRGGGGHVEQARCPADGRVLTREAPGRADEHALERRRVEVGPCLRQQRRRARDRGRGRAGAVHVPVVARPSGFTPGSEVGDGDARTRAAPASRGRRRRARATRTARRRARRGARRRRPGRWRGWSPHRAARLRAERLHACARGSATTGTGTRSSRPSAPAGARGRRRRTAAAPACAAKRASSAPRSPPGTSAARPATRL